MLASPCWVISFLLLHNHYMNVLRGGKIMHWLKAGYAPDQACMHMHNFQFSNINLAMYFKNDFDVFS